MIKFPPQSSLLMMCPKVWKYLLRDRFVTAESAPLTSPRTCEPGPGTLTIYDATNKLSISDNALNFSGISDWAGDPGWTFPVMRQAGRALIVGVDIASGNNFRTGFLDSLSWGGAQYLHWHPSIGGGSGATLVYDNNPAGDINVAPFATGTPYTYAVILRSQGAFCLLNGVLVWVSSDITTASMFAFFTTYDATGTLINPRILDIPSWSADANIYTSKLTSPAAGATATMTKDALIDASVTLPSAGTMQIMLRRTDDNNGLRLDIGAAGAGNCVLNSVTAGTPTALATGDLTSRVVVIADGTSVKMYCDNTLSGSGTDSTYGAETSVKVIGLGTGGAISTLYAWPRYPAFPTIP